MEYDELREQLACVRQALPEEWRDSVPSVAVATMAAEIAELKEAYALLRQVHADFRRECGDTDAILRVLGLDPVNCRTDGGSLKLVMILGALEHRDVMLRREAEQKPSRSKRLLAAGYKPRPRLPSDE